MGFGVVSYFGCFFVTLFSFRLFYYTSNLIKGFRLFFLIILAHSLSEYW